MNKADLTREWIQEVAKITLQEGPIVRNTVWIRKQSKTGKYRTLTPREEKGYLYLCFCVGKKRYKILAARVVCAVYKGVCPANMRVTYKDSDRTNIYPENLELMTAKELFHKKVWNRRK